MVLGFAGAGFTGDEAAVFVPKAFICTACGEVFPQNKYHADEDCAKGRSSWDRASGDQIAVYLRTLADQIEKEGA